MKQTSARATPTDDIRNSGRRSFRTRIGTWGLGVALTFILGATMDSCAFLDLLTGLYTGTYIEYNACPLVSGGGCEIYDVIDNTKQWQDCHMCTIDTVFPPDGSNASRIGKNGAAAVFSGELFWTENRDRILRAESGNAVSEIADAAYYPMGAAVDGSHIYWTDWRARGIRRANLNGTGVETLVTGLSGLSGLAANETTQKVYFGDPINGRIGVLDVASGIASDLVTGQTAPTDVELDGTGKIYWIDNDLTGGVIRRANVDGSSVETVSGSLTSPFGLALDVTAGKLYWTDAVDGAIRRSNLDGSSAEDLATSLNTPAGISVDPAGGKVYWVELGIIQVRRANLDGTGIETVSSGVPATDVVLDPGAGKLYASGWLGRSMWRANLDGTVRQTIVFTRQFSGDLALDENLGKVYWTSQSDASVVRANLDGSGTEDVATLQTAVDAVAFDPVTQKLFWTANGDVWRADPDGGNAATILTGIVFIGDIEIDPGAGKIYWINRQEIGKANLDGSGTQLFHTDTGFPESIAVSNGSVYWSVPFDGTIRRKNADGTGTIDDLVTGLGFVQAIEATDTELYWALPIPRRIQRSALDGTGVTDVLTGSGDITGVVAPSSVTLAVEFASVSAIADGSTALLKWSTTSEKGNLGFEVQMQQPATSDNRNTMEWLAHGFVEAAGNGDGHAYLYRVNDLAPGTHLFRIKQTDVDGSYTLTPEFSVEIDNELTFNLSNAFPNPFHQQAVVTLTVGRSQHVTVRVFDTLGRQLTQLFDGRAEEGRTYELKIDGTPWSSGIIFIDALGEGFHEARSAVLTR